MRNNYINKLQDDNINLRGKLARINQDCLAFQKFLNSDKFVGVDSHGDRKDWIATADVIEWLRNLRSESLLD